VLASSRVEAKASADDGGKKPVTRANSYKP
jgi:hypothetical protein